MNHFIEQLESLKTTFSTLPEDCLIDAIDRMDQTVEQLSQSIVFVDAVSDEQSEYLVDMGMGVVNDYLNPSDDFFAGGPSSSSTDDFNSPEFLATQFDFSASTTSESTSSSSSQLFCFTCGHPFNNRKGLYRHGVATKHRTRALKYYRQPANFEIQKNQRIQKTSDSDFSLDSEGSFLENSEGSDEKLACFECKMSFKNRKALYRHSKQTAHVVRLKRAITVKGGLYPCSKCTYSSEKMANLRLHFRRNHLDDDKSR